MVVPPFEETPTWELHMLGSDSLYYFNKPCPHDKTSTAVA